MCIRLAPSGRHRAHVGPMSVNKHHPGQEHRRPGLWEALLGSKGDSLGLMASTEQALVSGAQADPALMDKSGQCTGSKAQRNGPNWPALPQLPFG